MQKRKILVVLLSVIILITTGFILWEKDIIRLPFSRPTPTPASTPTPAPKEISLSLVKEYNTGLNGFGWQVSSENFIYFTHLAGGGIQLAVLDISDIFNPKKVYDSTAKAFMFPSNEIEAMYLKDNYLYISGSTVTDEVEIDVYDISDPSKPKFVWFQDGFINQITSFDNYLFLLGSKFLIFDISNPAKPILLSTRETNDIGTDAMCVSGGYVYTADKFKGFKVIDVSDKRKPTILGETWGYANDLLCFNNLVYGITNSSFDAEKDVFYVRDFSDLKDVKNLRVLEKEQLRDFYQIEENLFVTYKGGILVFDISNPADPVLKKDIPGDFGLISGQGKYLYSIIDNPSNLRQSLLKIYEIKYE